MCVVIFLALEGLDDSDTGQVLLHERAVGRLGVTQLFVVITVLFAIEKCAESTDGSDEHSEKSKPAVEIKQDEEGYEQPDTHDDRGGDDLDEPGRDGGNVRGQAGDDVSAVVFGQFSPYALLDAVEHIASHSELELFTDIGIEHVREGCEQDGEDRCQPHICDVGPVEGTGGGGVNDILADDGAHKSHPQGKCTDAQLDHQLFPVRDRLREEP